MILKIASDEISTGSLKLRAKTELINYVFLDWFNLF